MRILFLSDNFPPEVNAPASRTFDHCREWVKNGDEVTVITCCPNFPQGKVYKGYRNKVWQQENIEGIRVIRVWSFIAANRGFIKRTIDFISFSISSFIAGLFIKADIIVATSPQFFAALSGRALSFWKRKPWIMEVRDLWPDSLKTVGLMKDNLLIRYLEWQEKRCYRSAGRIVVVTDSFKQALIDKGVSPQRIEVVKNGVDPDLFIPQPKNQHLISKIGLEGKTIIGYIGTHGMAHKLDFILEVAAKLKESKPEYHFIFIGDGAEKGTLLRLKKALDCNNVTMLDSVPKNEVREYISILDVSLINLRKSPLFTTVIPSKIFENAAMEIPILIGVEGESKDLIERYHAGVCFEPENDEDFIAKLEIAADPNNKTAFKEGCRRLASDFNRTHLAKKMSDVLHAAIYD